MEIDNLLEYEKREDLRQWLQAHHTVASHCWVATYRSRKPKGKSLPYHEVVEEALCFGWIDSTLKRLPDGHWYKMTAKPGTYNDNDPIGVLDVTILSNLVLDKVLGIKDLRTDKRIDFVGGIRGLGELKRRVDNGEMKVAFALYPVSMKQIIDIADTGNIMPPKTTWFEPKLRSGLVIHELC